MEDHDSIDKKALSERDIKPHHGIVCKYSLYLIWADAGNGTLAKYFTGATVKHLPGKALAQYVCALPPLAEQERIVRRIEQLLDWCDALEAQLKAAEEERGGLAYTIEKE
jgi:type I restriction enzyme S subunit